MSAGGHELGWPLLAVLSRPMIGRRIPRLRRRLGWLLHPFATWNKRLAELDVDDTKLEDELEPLYQHGSKMDSGLGQGQNQLGSFH